jgi:type I restriction enzyme M protein
MKHKVDVKIGDILLVRDGTYLIGTSAVVTQADLPMLFQSHIYKIRVQKPSTISPWLLFACLNTPIVKRQIRSKQFTQDIIDTLGKRFSEIIIPVPKDANVVARVSRETKEIIETRATLRNRAKALALELQGPSTITSEDLEVLSDL